MSEKLPLQEISSKVQELHKLAQALYDMSDDFPAVNRNLKRILASLEMLRINLEEPGD